MAETGSTYDDALKRIYETGEGETRALSVATAEPYKKIKTLPIGFKLLASDVAFEMLSNTGDENAAGIEKLKGNILGGYERVLRVIGNDPDSKAILHGFYGKMGNYDLDLGKLGNYNLNPDYGLVVVEVGLRFGYGVIFEFPKEALKDFVQEIFPSNSMVGAALEGFLEGLFSPDLAPTQEEVFKDGKYLGKRDLRPEEIFRKPLVDEIKDLKNVDPRITEAIMSNAEYYGRQLAYKDGIVDRLFKASGMHDNDGTVSSIQQKKLLLAQIGKTTGKIINNAGVDKFGDLKEYKGREYDLTNRREFGELINTILPKLQIGGQEFSLQVQTPEKPPKDLSKTREIIEDMFHQSGIIPEEFLRMAGLGNEVNSPEAAVDKLADSGDEEALKKLANKIAGAVYNDLLSKDIKLTEDEQQAFNKEAGLEAKDKVIVSLEGEVIAVDENNKPTTEMNVAQLEIFMETIQNKHLDKVLENAKQQMLTPKLSYDEENTGGQLYEKYNAIHALAAVITEQYKEQNPDAEKKEGLHRILVNQANGELYVEHTDNEGKKFKKAKDYFDKNELTKLIESVTKLSAQERLYKSFLTFARRDAYISKEYISKEAPERPEKIFDEKIFNDLLEEGIGNLPKSVSGLAPELQDELKNIAKTMNEQAKLAAIHDLTDVMKAIAAAKTEDGNTPPPPSDKPSRGR